MRDPAQASALFVADTHFHLRPDAAERRRRDRFLDLCDLASRAGHLVLLGDLFDFWFDYPHFRLRGYEEVLQALDRVRAAGTHLHFVGGNHDIWAAPYMQERYGCAIRPPHSDLAAGGLRVRLCHGDGMFKLDWAYGAFRTVVRAKAGIAIAKSLHPELLFALSTWLSGRSRCATRDEAAVIERRAATWLATQVSPPGSEPDWDLMIIGHVHHGFTTAAGDRRLAALPGWLGALGYAVLNDGRLSLLDFERDPLPDLG
ncbi:MAG: metallophosphoesterase [bacterium]|nr:metallophosphoesterase [bacterium]